MIKKSQLKPQTISPTYDTAKLVQNDQSLDQRVSALEKSVEMLMRVFRQYQDTGVMQNDESGLE